MTKEELNERTKKFAVLIIKIIEEIPDAIAGQTISNQVIRTATSVAANYRSAYRARSTADFISKITIVEEECDETLFWLELKTDTNLLSQEKLAGALKEAK